MQQCWQHDAEKRPTAEYVTNYLEKCYKMSVASTR